jgi:hypothetical protein
MGFDDATLLMFALPHEFLSGDSPQPHFGFRNLVADIPFREAPELIDRYAAAVEQDAVEIGSRSYWTDSEDDERDMVGVLHETFDALKRRAPDYVVDMLGDRFAAFTLPLADGSRARRTLERGRSGRP